MPKIIPARRGRSQPRGRSFFSESIAQDSTTDVVFRVCPHQPPQARSRIEGPQVSQHPRTKPSLVSAVPGAHQDLTLVCGRGATTTGTQRYGRRAGRVCMPYTAVAKFSTMPMAAFEVLGEMRHDWTSSALEIRWRITLQALRMHGFLRVERGINHSTQAW